jgi:adenosylcobyric acid synthase
LPLAVEPSRLLDADLVLLPGSKATVSDLGWLRRTGLADAVLAHARAGRPVLGICGGYQILGRGITDPHRVEGRDATGLGTHWHGLLENDGFRRALPHRVVAQAGRAGFVAVADTCFAAERDRQLDVLGDLVGQHLDLAALEDVISHGAPAEAADVTSGLAGSGL